MTVIAWDGKTMAADKLASIGNIQSKTTKIWKLETGEVLAGAGNLTRVLELKEWYESGADIRDWPQQSDEHHETQFAEVLVATPNGKLYSLENAPVPIEIEDSFFSIGSGSKVAMGAMLMGADAVTAVMKACEICIDCGIGVDAFPVLAPKVKLRGRFKKIEDAKAKTAPKKDKTKKE